MNTSSMKNWTILTAATLFGLAAAVGANEPAKPGADNTATAPVVDTAANSTVAIDPRFTALDKDGDGSLLQADLPAGHDLGTDLFAAFDTDKDQRISNAEFSVYAGGNDEAMEEAEGEEGE